MNDPDPLDDTGTPIPPPPSGARSGASPSLQEAPAGRRSFAQALAATLPVMLRRARRQELPVPTPWRSLNEALGGGLWPGFYTLTSGTGAGKTQWALQVALAAAQDELATCEAIALEAHRAGQPPPTLAPRPVVYVALELGELDLSARLLALLEAQHHQAPPRWSEFAYGQAGEERLVEAVCRQQTAADRLPLLVEVAPPQGWQAEELASLAELNPRPRLVVLDYLQLVAHERHEDARAAMTRVAYQARALARDHGVVVLALCSTARVNYASTRAADQTAPWERDPGEFVGLGKESGDIEYAADGVLTMLRQPSQGEGPDRMHLAVAKQRGGRTAWVRLLFDGSTFSDEPRPPPSAPSSPAAKTSQPSSPARIAHDFPDEE